MREELKIGNMKIKELEKVLKDPSVVFNEKEHTYMTPNGELYTGCTTISGAWRKDFLAPWYAKEMQNFIMDVPYDAIMKMTPDEFSLFIQDAKGAAKRKSDEAKENGTLAHDWIEAALSKKLSTDGKSLPMPESPEAKSAIKAFIDWAKAHDIKWLASEEIVCSDVYRVAGKLDAIAVVDGITYLVDFKTSSQIGEDYLVQCAGYDLMLREMGLQVMGYLILRIPKDGTPAETLTITNQTDMAFFRDTFLRLREAHKFFVLMQSRFKDERGKMKVDYVENQPIQTNAKSGETIVQSSVSEGESLGGKVSAISTGRSAKRPAHHKNTVRGGGNGHRPANAKAAKRTPARRS